jgi:hypothetical protein
MAISTPEIAQSCFYVLPPRRGMAEKIEGPSVRLAEIAAGAWGNLRCEARISDIGERTVTGQGTVWDMQRNVLIRCETSVRIITKEGRRYSDDMIVTNGNAAASKAFRNAVFKVVPYAYIQEIFLECMRVAATSNGGIDQAKRDWINLFVRQGISEQQVLDMLETDSVEDMGLDNITTLQGLHTALSEGQTTLEQVFPEALEPGSKQFGFKRKAGRPASDKRKPAQSTRAKAAEAKPESKPAPSPEPSKEESALGYTESEPWDNTKHWAGPGGGPVQREIGETVNNPIEGDVPAGAQSVTDKA